MGEVIDINPANNPDTVLKAAVGGFDEVLILGYNTQGFLEIRASGGMSTKSELLFIIESFKTALMMGAYDGHE